MKEKGKIRAVVFVRVSTRAQNTDRQEDDLRALAAKKGWGIAGVIRETISGASKNGEREGVQLLLDMAGRGDIDKVLVQEVSRLGRSTAEILKVVEALTAEKVSIYVQNFNLETLDAKGGRNPMAQFMFTMLAEFARMEREHLRERIMSGLERARRKGVRLGRPKGTVVPAKETLKRYPCVVRELRSGQSVRKTAKICGASPTTVLKVKRLMG